MKTAIGILMTAALSAASGMGCSATQDSRRGGTAPTEEEFSITVPTSITIKQGMSQTEIISLNRGADFKRDVMLDIKTEGISVTPVSVMVKASDKPEVRLQIMAPRDAALGGYHVSVKGTPESGDPTSTDFTVTVVDQ